MPGCPPKVKSGPDLLIYTHLPPAERERYSSEASTTTTSIVQRFERGLNEVGATVTQCSPLSILATSNQVECRFTVEQEETELGRCSLLGGCKVGVAVGGAGLLHLFLQTEKKLYFGSGNQCYAGRSAGDTCQVRGPPVMVVLNIEHLFYYPSHWHCVFYCMVDVCCR